MDDLIQYVLRWCANLPGRTLGRFAGDMIRHVMGVRSYRRRRRD